MPAPDTGDINVAKMPPVGTCKGEVPNYKMARATPEIVWIDPPGEGPVHVRVGKPA